MLNLTQKKILKLLAINCRYTNKDIAQSIGMSEDVVKYHIEKLVDKEKIVTLTAYFDYKHIGMYHHHYLIRLKDVTNNRISELLKIKEIFFINTSAGKFDLQLIIYHEDDESLLSTKSKIDAILKDNITDSILLKFYVQYKWNNVMPLYDATVKKPSNNKNPVYKLNKSDWHQPSPKLMPKPKLTDAEKKTIRILIDSPRASYSDIARKTNQNVESVRQQIYRFVEKEYIGNFGIFPDFGKLKYFTAYMLVNIREIEKSKLQAYVQSRKNTFYAAELIGKYNMIFYIIGQTQEEINIEAFEMRRMLKDKVIDLEMLTYDRVYKSVQFPETLLD